MPHRLNLAALATPTEALYREECRADPAAAASFAPITPLGLLPWSIFRLAFALVVALLLSRGLAAQNQAAGDAFAASRSAPNVIVILLDDSGFSDASAFGGTAQTPALDRLAAGGLRFNQFHTTAICTATRASLLTGLNHHRAGFGALADSAGESPGYDCRWRGNTPSIAAVLRQNGYSTAAFGKWHNTHWMEITPAGPFDRWPTGLGFDQFYGFMQPGASSQWEPHSMYRDTTPIEPVARPGQPYHMTTDLVDRAIDWVQTQQSTAPGKPYFLYLAPAAVHFPHHAPKEWIEKYRGRFDQGWDEYRREVFARQKELGVVPPDAELTPRPGQVPAWDSLTADQRRFFANQMEVYAGFVAHTDHEVGRLLHAVQEGPEGENTLIFYIVGDNGGSAGAGAGDQLAEKLKHIDEMGGPRHLNGFETGWAWAVGTPFQYWKGVASHLGGVRNPLVVSWPVRIRDRGALRTQFTHVNDIAATIYECTGVTFPARYKGLDTIPLDGVSFAPALERADAVPARRTQYFEMFGNRSIYENGWIASSRRTPANNSTRGAESPEDDRWELYHVAEDFSQARDLAGSNPAKLAELKALFESEARRNQVYPRGERGPPPRPGPGYAPATGPETVVYHAGLPRLLGIAAPNFVRSHRVTAEVVLPEANASGVLISWGCRWSGFVLYVQDGRLVFDNNDSIRGLTRLVSPALLRPGRLQLGFEYDAKSNGPPHRGASSNGTVRLLVDGRPVADATVAMETSSASWGSFGIGQAFGSPVSPAIHPPFRFTGRLSSVEILLK